MSRAYTPSLLTLRRHLRPLSRVVPAYHCGQFSARRSDGRSPIHRHRVSSPIDLFDVQNCELGRSMEFLLNGQSSLRTWIGPRRYLHRSISLDNYSRSFIRGQPPSLEMGVGHKLELHLFVPHRSDDIEVQALVACS